MSEWFTIDDDDIEIDEPSEEVNVLFTSNDSGNVYVTLTFNQIKEISAKIASK